MEDFLTMLVIAVLGVIKDTNDLVGVKEMTWWE